MKKIGIMGGTFDPIHNGHLKLASSAKQQYVLDEVWFMPSKIPPHKRGVNISSEEDRMHMVELAIKGYDGFVSSDFELRRPETTYTAHTVRLLKEQYPEYAFYFIMGGDSLFYFEKWYQPEEIVKYVHILSSGRDGSTRESLQKRCDELHSLFQGDFSLIEMEDYQVSSSELRQKIKDGNSIQEYIPIEVEQYIRLNKLYKV